MDSKLIRRIFVGMVVVMMPMVLCAQNRLNETKKDAVDLTDPNGEPGVMCWRLVKTEVEKNEDWSRDNGMFCKHTISENVHQSEGAYYGIVGPYDDSKLFSVRFAAGIKSPPARIKGGDSIALRAAVYRMSDEATCYVSESPYLSFEDASVPLNFISDWAIKGETTQLQGSTHVGTRPKSADYGRWIYVIRNIPTGKEGEEKALNFAACGGRTHWVYRWCGHIEDSTKAKNEGSGYWKQVDKQIVRNYKYIHMDSVKYKQEAVYHKDENHYIPGFTKRCLLTDVSYTRFHMKELYYGWYGTRSMERGRRLVSDAMDFCITYTEPETFYRAGDKIESTYETSTSIPEDMDEKRRVHISPMMIAGGICKERNSTVPLASTAATYLYNLAEDYSFKVLTTKQNRWVDIEEHVSAKMPEGKVYGDVVHVRFEAHKDSVYANIYYTYEWTEGEMPVMKSAGDGNTGGSPAKDSPVGDMVPVILWLGGAGGGAVVVWINRNRLNEIFKKYGTSDTTAIRKIQKQNQTKDEVDGLKEQERFYNIDANITLLEATDKTGDIATEVAARAADIAAPGSGTVLKMKLVGAKTYLKGFSEDYCKNKGLTESLFNNTMKTVYEEGKVMLMDGTPHASWGQKFAIGTSMDFFSGMSDDLFAHNRIRGLDARDNIVKNVEKSVVKNLFTSVIDSIPGFKGSGQFAAREGLQFGLNQTTQKGVELFWDNKFKDPDE